MKLPIGIQTFSQMREEDYVYVDKTKEALELIDSYKYLFLSRPRRFGKSLFLDTLKNIFEGKKEYFKGLYIEDKYNFDETYPVIHISFAGELFTQEGINQVFKKILTYNQERLGIECSTDLDMPSCFDTLIRKTYEKYNKKVVVLIDEYDKPILDNITDKPMAEFSRKKLKSFYEIMKDKDEYIKFVFITGVSKFAKVSIFSGLNNLRDITLNPKYGNICGYTQEDVETTFAPLLKDVDLEELKLWYNGYYFLKDRIYNPFDILLFCDSDYIYKNYWFDTGTPTFLINLIKEQNYFLPNLENIVISDTQLNSFDIDNIDLEVVLYQAGYLTIKDMLPNPLGGYIYKLTIPNKEVKLSLYGAIMDMFVNTASQRTNIQTSTYIALANANKEDFQKALISLFASIPYQNYTKNDIANYEGYYASMIYVYIASLGLEVDVENSTNKGRVDMSILLNNNRYIIEFKVGDEDPISQIKEKRYYQKYLCENSNIYLVGINFSKDDRNISKLKWEEFFFRINNKK